MQHHSGFEPVTLKREKLTFSSSSLYQQSYRATCNLKISISGFLMNHLVWNFVFTQYLGPSAFRKTKALGSSFKQWEYRGPSFYCSYCSHRTVAKLNMSTVSHTLDQQSKRTKVYPFHLSTFCPISIAHRIPYWERSTNQARKYWYIFFTHAAYRS